MATTKKATAAKTATKTATKTTTAKKCAAKTTNKVSVKISVTSCANELYIVGNTKNLSAWDAEKAVKLTKKGNKFTKALSFDANEVVEFKVLAAKAWGCVEKGAYGEEVENHSFAAKEGLVVELEVNNFAC